MSEPFYTDEELALLNSMSEVQLPQPTAPNEHPDTPQLTSYTAPDEASTAGRIGEGLGKLSATLSDSTHPVNRGLDIARGVYMIVFGGIFVVIPIVVIVPNIMAFRAAEAGLMGYIPLLIVGIFVLVGGSVVFKGIKRIIRAIKGK